ncbi:MAG: molybdenum cofactor guanylyltransferase [Vicinamibacterales bacterium]
MISWTAAILAGGQARRLGGIDKSALVVGARSILDRQLSLLRGLTPHLLIVTSDRSRMRAVDVPVVVDRIGGAGALGGLYTALIEAPTEQVLVIGCDMPFLTAPFLLYLAERGRDIEAAVPRDAHGRHPLCASYARRTAPHFQARIQAGDLRVGDALTDLPVLDIGPDELSRFNPDGRLLLNVNTPDDYARARRITAVREKSRGTDPDPPTG